MQASISLDYDILGLPEADVRALASELSVLAPTRARLINKDRGGITPVLWVVASYVGLKLADALIDEVAGKFVQAVGAKVRAFCSRLSSAGSEWCVSLRVSCDDVDVEIILPTDADERFLARVIDEVSRHLGSDFLRGRHVRYVLIPVEHFDCEWQASDFWRVADHRRILWGLGSHHFPYVVEAYCQ